MRNELVQGNPIKEWLMLESLEGKSAIHVTNNLAYHNDSKLAHPKPS